MACFCSTLPALGREAGAFSEEVGTARWYFRQYYPAYADRRPEILHKPRGESARAGKRHKARGGEIRTKIEKHIKNSYLKRVDAPVGTKLALRCWMKLNAG